MTECNVNKNTCNNTDYIIDPAIRNPRFWGFRAAKRPRVEGFHFAECDLEEGVCPDWWNADDVDNPPMKSYRRWFDPNGTTVSGFTEDGYATYTQADLDFAFNDYTGERFVERPPEPIYVDSEEESEEVVEETDAEIKAKHNTVASVKITQTVINKNSRHYKEAKALSELLAKNGGINDTKISHTTINLEAGSNVDPVYEFFMVPTIGSIVLVLAKAIAFFGAATSTASTTKLSHLKNRLDDLKSKLRSLQIQHRITPSDDATELKKRDTAETLLAGKIEVLKTEIDGRMNMNTSVKKSVERAELVTCRRLLRMVCKQNSDATQFMEALRDIYTYVDAAVAVDEIKHNDAVFHIRANKISRNEADKLKQKKIQPVPVIAPVIAPVVAPVIAPVVARAPAPVKKGPSRSEKLAALRAGKK